MDCSECVFALDDESDCRTQRLGKLINIGKAYQRADGYYELDQFCNMYRSKDSQWEKDLGDRRAVETVMDEVLPLVGICVEDNPSCSGEDLIRTLDSLYNIRHPSSKLKIVVSTFNARGMTSVVGAVNKLQNIFPHTSAVFQLSDRRSIQDEEVFKRLMEASYFMTVHAGAVVPQHILQWVNKSLNKDLEKITMFEAEGLTIIRKNVVRMAYLDYNNYSEMVDFLRTKSIEENSYKKYEEQ